MTQPRRAPDPLPNHLTAAVKHLLAYSFRDTGYDYNQLTPHEQSLLTCNEFDALVLWVKR